MSTQLQHQVLTHETWKLLTGLTVGKQMTIRILFNVGLKVYFNVDKFFQTEYILLKT